MGGGGEEEEEEGEARGQHAGSSEGIEPFCGPSGHTSSRLGLLGGGMMGSMILRLQQARQRNSMRREEKWKVGIKEVYRASLLLLNYPSPPTSLPITSL